MSSGKLDRWKPPVHPSCIRQDSTLPSQATTRWTRQSRHRHHCLLKKVISKAKKTLPSKPKWLENLALVKEHIKSSNKVCYPRKTRNPKLHTWWCSEQLKAWRSGVLAKDPSKVALLKEIGLIHYWESESRPQQKYSAKDEAMFTQKVKLITACQEMGEFEFGQKKHKLGMWVYKQRARRDAMGASRKKQLDAIGFAWDVASTKQKSKNGK